MINRLSRLYPKVQKLLWILVAIGLLSAIPLTIERVQIEQSTKQVELLLDHQDLVRTSTFYPNPQQYLEEQYERIKAAGISSFAVFETTLVELEERRRIQLYNSYEASLLRGSIIPADESFTYLLFTNEQAQDVFKPMIEREFARRGIPVRAWSYNDQPGLIIEASYNEASMYPMEPDPLTIAELRDRGFQVVVRLSDNRPLELDEIEDLLSRLSEQQVRWIVYAGTQVMGRGDGTDPQRLQSVAELMKEYGLGFAVIELNQPQVGAGQLAYYTDYNTIRLHSITERESSALSSSRLADRMVLAVTDRNIRMIYLNIEITRDVSKAEMKNSLNNVLTALEGERGAIAQIQASGYELGLAEPFDNYKLGMHRIFKLITVIGGVALVALMAGAFVPPLLAPIFAIGLVGTAGLYLLNSSLLLQALALAAAIAAPVLAAIYIMRRLQRTKEASSKSGEDNSVNKATVMPLQQAIGRGIVLFIQAAGISLIGAVYVFGLLNTIPYMLVLEQFRGVSLLHVAPIALAGLYYLFYLDTKQSIPEKIKSLFMSNIKLGYVVVLGLFGAAILYYLSRTGNTGQASGLEMMFRATLEDVLGIRPRTKEFLIGHPLLLFGIVVSLRYRFGIFILIPAVIGQLSMVDTFAHLHTPLWISAVRVLYGLGFGLLIGLIAIVVWEMLLRSWHKWIDPPKAS